MAGGKGEGWDGLLVSLLRNMVGGLARDRGYAKNILITGPPGCGKSTLLERLIAGEKIGGISTPEIRKGGYRTGFEIVDLKGGRRGVLASVDIEEGPAVGKYRVNLKDLDEIGSKALDEAVGDKEVEIIVIDEIGKMECFSERFKRAVVTALGSGKKVLAAISLKDFDPFIREIKARHDSRLFYLRREDFEKILTEIKAFID